MPDVEASHNTKQRDCKVKLQKACKRCRLPWSHDCHVGELFNTKSLTNEDLPVRSINLTREKVKGWW